MTLSTYLRRCLLLTVLVLGLVSVAHAAKPPSILASLKQKDGQTLLLSGTVSDAPADLPGRCVKTAVRSSGERGWSLQDGCLALRINAGRGEFSSDVEGLRQAHRGLELQAVLLRNANTLTSRVIDEPTLAAGSLARSETFSLGFGPTADSPKPPPPRILLTHVGHVPVEAEQNKPINVGLQEQVQGLRSGPEGLFTHIIVVPLAGNSRWSMDSDPQGQRIFYARASFGREGLDEFEHFAVFAVLSKSRLSPGEILPARWDALRRTTIVATSPPVLAIRTASPFDPRTDLNVEIREVGGAPVDKGGTVTALYDGQVSGRLVGRKLAPTETLTLYVRTGPGELRRIDSPRVAPDGTWHTQGQRLGRPGEEVMLLAAVASGANGVYDTQRVVAESPVFRLLLKDEAVRFVSINGSRVPQGDRAPLVLHGPASLRLELARKTADPGFVLVFWRPTGAAKKTEWRLLSRTARGEDRLYRTLPTSVPEGADSLELIAVVATRAIQGLASDDERAAVGSVSAPVFVKMSAEGEKEVEP